MLNPAQQRVIDDLFSFDQPRPSFSNALEDGLAPLADRLDPLPLVIRKGTLARIHQCETHYQAEENERFRWNVASSRGTIAHRAIELSAFRKDGAAPLDLVDDVIERFSESGDDWTPRDFLRSAMPNELAELRSEASDIVTAFEATFPPLRPNWRPRLESSCRVELCADRVVLRAKVDLALGQPSGDQARVLIVDFKTGKAHSTHLEDLRFYALVETLRSGVPPFRVASYYLESARWKAEDITEELLVGAVRRVIGGATKLTDLLLGERQPTLTPGPACSYCPLKAECPGALEWAEHRESLGVDA
jgi:hypothetical protein